MSVLVAFMVLASQAERRLIRALARIVLKLLRVILSPIVLPQMVLKPVLPTKKRAAERLSMAARPLQVVFRKTRVAEFIRVPISVLMRINRIATVSISTENRLALIRMTRPR
ncbi:hypothetical protein D9M70_467340 [compost metagenome]